MQRVFEKTPEVGRWDDLLVHVGTVAEEYAFSVIKKALAEGNGLCAKWMPRKGDVANKLRKFLGLTPKEYRKLLVNLSNTVEQKMCAKTVERDRFWKSSLCGSSPVSESILPQCQRGL